MEIYEILDRFELLNPDEEYFSNLRRAYIDKDLSSIFKISDVNANVRRAVEFKNLHSIFRCLDEILFYHDWLPELKKVAVNKNLHSLFRLLEEKEFEFDIEDFRKAVLEQNVHSIFRLLGNDEYTDDLRKAVTEKNLHSVFRLLDQSPGDKKYDVEEFRKAVLEQNVHSIFRLLEGCKVEGDIEDLRKAVAEGNMRSLFRLVDVDDDFRKAIIEGNLHSIFRIFDINEDLRKAIVEENIHSIFRLLDTDEDLRKAVSEENIHSIWRLLIQFAKDQTVLDGTLEELRNVMLNQNLISLFNLLPPELEDFRKAILDDNLDSTLKIINDNDIRTLLYADERWSMFRLLERKTQSRLMYTLKEFHMNSGTFDKDCLSRGQIKSKMWLIHHLEKVGADLGVVFLCAGWYATLATMLFESGLKIQKIRSFDIDPDVWEIAETFNKPWMAEDWKFKASTKDIYDIDFLGTMYDVYKGDGNIQPLMDTPNTIINTSCEHIEHFAQWFDRIPKGKLCVMQANDYEEIEEHVNYYNTLEDFSKDCPMEKVFYEGELDLGEYKRFMKIGYR